MTDFPPWLSCPACGFDEFDEEDLPNGEGRISCPDCGETTGRRLNYGTIPTSEELADVTGMDPDHFERDTPDPAANDEPEVTEDGLVFKQDEAFYQVGKHPFYCPHCEQKCEMTCDGYGLVDVAYCDTCHIEYTRDRKPLVDDVSNGVVVEQQAHERDVYEEYTCDHCGESHQYTRPDGQYSEPSFDLGSYERIWLSCLCGATLNGELAVGDVVECPSCPRVFTLQVEMNETSTGAQEPDDAD